MRTRRLAPVVGLIIGFGCTSESQTYGVSESALEHPAPVTTELAGNLDVIDARAAYTTNGCQFNCTTFHVSGQREVTSKGNFVFVGYPANGGPFNNPWPAISVSRLDASTGAWLHSAPVLYGIGILDGPHEDVAIRVDGDNRIHLWGGMHGNQMWYQRSSSLDPTSAWSGLNMIGNAGPCPGPACTVAPGGYTYPEAATSPVTGDVFYISRKECDFTHGETECDVYPTEEDGTPTSNIHSYAHLFQYKRSSGTWFNRGKVFSGFDCKNGPDATQCQEGGIEYTPYLPELVVDSQGQVHIAAIWQLNVVGQPGTRHQGTYVRYDPDGGGFYKADGTNITNQMPITTLNRDSVFQWQPRQLAWTANEMVADMRLSVDAADRPVIGYSVSPDAKRDPKQQRVATWTGQVWQRTTLADTGYIYSIVTPISSGGLIRTYFHDDESPTNIFVHQSYYNGQIWDTGRLLYNPLPNGYHGYVQSVFNRDSNNDVVLTNNKILNVSFTLPSPPTRKQLNPIADSYVRAGIYANTNYGTASGILVKNYLPTNDNTRMVYLKFNLAGQNLLHVRRARLKMYVSCCTTTGGPLYLEAVPVTAYAVSTDSWQENTITWASKPSLGSSLGQAHIGFINHEYIWDVTTHVKNAFETDQIVTIALFVESNTVNTAVQFNSREATTFKPVLIIDDYQDPTASGHVQLPNADATVRSGFYANTNFGSSSDLFVKRASNLDGLDTRTSPPDPNCTQDTSSDSTMSYLKFNLSALPTNGVNRAVLRVFNNTQPGNPSIDVTAYFVPNDSWLQGSITWNAISPGAGSARPCTLGDAMDTITVTNTASFFEFDVTPYVNKEWAGDKVLSIALYRTGPGSGTSVQFGSTEYGGALPQLRLTY